MKHMWEDKNDHRSHLISSHYLIRQQPKKKKNKYSTRQIRLQAKIFFFCHSCSRQMKRDIYQMESTYVKFYVCVDSNLCLFMHVQNSKKFWDLSVKGKIRQDQDLNLPLRPCAGRRVTLSQEVYQKFIQGVRNCVRLFKKSTFKVPIAP